MWSMRRNVVANPSSAACWQVLLAFWLVLSPMPVCKSPAASATPNPTAAWGFSRPGDFEGWQPNGHCSEAQVTAGVLRLRGAGADPILEYQPGLDLTAGVWSVVEVRLKADRDGTAELFWSNTRAGRYGGFSQDKAVRFPVRGDQSWRTYRIRPGWHPEGRIVRLRLDLYDAAQFELDSIQVVEPGAPQAPVPASFDFTRGLAGWHGEDGARVESDRDALRIQTIEPLAFAAAPAVDFPAEPQAFLVLRMSVDAGRHATLLFATADRPQLHRFSFPIEADGREHLYNIDLLAALAWRGRIVALGLRPSDDAQAAARVTSLKFAATPEGEAALAVKWFGPEETLPRVGRPTTLTAVVENRGGTVATEVRASLDPPRGWTVLPAESEAVPSLAPGEDTTFRWQLTSPTPQQATVRLSIQAANIPAARAERSLSVTRPPQRTGPDYVPTPMPVRGPLEVGVYYFPGWRTAAPWQPIRAFPERRPTLGWYREGDPEVADWHIKWAVEHGITFFIYDWYWVRGARQLEHALHDGFFSARYRHLLKFCLLWANHNPPGTSTPEDCLEVTRYWITNYFRRPEHMTIESKPLMVIFAPQRLAEDLGASHVRPTLDAMRSECVRAGLPGLYLAACVGDAAQARQAAAEGYDAVTAYTWPHLGVPSGEWRAPFASILEGYRRQWAHLADTAGIPLLPPVCGGWDSRPWHGENNFIRSDRTPALFQEHLSDARRFVEAARGRTNVRPTLILEAWNEWGEGAYIEPQAEHGFGYLDAIRAALTDSPAGHVDVTPADIDRGPYDVATPDPGRTAWEFNQDDGGWAPFMNLAHEALRDGCLVLQTTARDPALASPPLELRASAVRAIRFRARLTNPGGASASDLGQIYWTTSRIPETAASGKTFEVALDGEWHDYAIPVSDQARWRGRITRVRLDPCERPGVRVEIDWIRF